MNKLLLTLISICFLSNFMHGQDVGRVIIKNGATNFPKFIISINGVRLSNEYNSTISFNYLDESNYRIKVLQSGSTNVLTFMLASAPNYISKYIITKDNYGAYGLILESKTLITTSDEIIPTPPVPDVLTHSLIPAATQTVVSIPTPTFSLPPTPTVLPTPTIEITPQPMDEVEYAGIITTLKKESLENGRNSIAKTFFNKKNLNTTQVVGILKQFYLEKNRLELSKYFYDQTIDKQNYFKVLEVLSFSSSKKDLAAFIKSKQ